MQNTIYKILIFLSINSFHNAKALENIVDAHSDEYDRLNYGANKYVQAVKLIIGILKRGLGQRVSLISTLPRQLKEWDMSDDIPNDLERFYIGLQFDSHFFSNIIEKGPGANLSEVCMCACVCAQQQKKYRIILTISIRFMQILARCMRAC